MIETTVNLDVNIYNKLVQSAKEKNIPLRKIIHVLFKFMLFERPVDIAFFKRIRYQGRIQGRKWKCLHIQLNEGSYEACLDMRKLFKKSVSFLLSIAVELYLEQIMIELANRDEGTDNYLELYNIFLEHSIKKSTFTVFYTFPDTEDIPQHFTMPEI